MFTRFLERFQIQRNFSRKTSSAAGMKGRPPSFSFLNPTTRTCLETLWEIYQKEKPKKVLDLGTGSGIQALAAAKWGAEKVLAIDFNELAVETTLRNVLSNGESQRIEVKMGKAEDFIEEEADLVCANIHLQVIESLLKKKAFFKKRWFIFSGVFGENAEEIERRLIQGSVEIVQRLKEKNWLTSAFHCVRKITFYLHSKSKKFKFSLNFD